MRGLASILLSRYEEASQQETSIDDEWSFTDCRWILYQEGQDDLELLASKFRRLS